MSVIYAINGQYLSETVSSGVITGTSIYFTLPWHPCSTIERIRIWNTTSSTNNIDEMHILSNGSHFRNGGGTPDSDYVYYSDFNDQSVSATNNYTIIWSLNPAVYIEDLYNRPYLSVLVILKTSVTNGRYFLNVVGKKNVQTSNYILADRTNVEETKDYRVLVGQNQTGTGGTGGVIYDVSTIAKGNGGMNSNEFAFKSANDYVYLGSSRKIDHWEFVLKTPAGTATTITGQIWNGTTWSTFRTFDNTSSGNSDTLKYSGVIEGSGLGSSVWGPVKLSTANNPLFPNDPLTLLEDSMIAGLTQPVNLPANPPRFWARFKVWNVASNNIEIARIIPISENY
jgi:hypothetical protein